MSFSRAKAAGWAVGDIFTSAQGNQLDQDHANSLDKSVAGDQLQGIITMTSGAAIQASVQGGLQSTTPGGFQLNGGNADWQTFGPAGGPRTRTRWRPMQVNTLATGWTFLGGGLLLEGPATTAQQFIQLPDVHQGATLSSVTISFALPSLPAGQPPNQLKLSVQRSPIGAGAGATATLNSSDGGGPAGGLSPSTINILTNGQQTFTYSCNQNNLIDATNYIYYAFLIDNNGSGALQTLYYGIQVFFNQITDMRFP